MVEPETFATIRRELVLNCCKWDPQVGDIGTLAPFPLVVRRSVWEQLASWAEALAVEAAGAEAEMLQRPELHSQLGIPRAIRRALSQAKGLGTTPAVARVIRFDFHWTTEGWRISEANSDVPGGFTEASSFTQRMAEKYPGLAPAGDPAKSWADAMLKNAKADDVALLVAPGYMEDQQVVAYLAQMLRARGLYPHVCGPNDLRWRHGRAFLDTEFHYVPIDSVVRFYQGEWLASLPRSSGWSHLFCGGITPVSNPGVALLVESKRFPLVWDYLQTPLSTWRELLPPTRHPRDLRRLREGEWLLKTAYCNNGDEVAMRDSPHSERWRKASRSARWNPTNWITQRKFDPIPVSTPLGPMYPCIGVYTVNGKAAGAYGRITGGPVIDYSAIDIAVLVSKHDGREVGE
jgi:glutathionylspermidine synthase